MSESEVSGRPALRPSVAWKPIAIMGLLVFLIFADMLVAPGSFVLGNKTTDMFLQFFSWRQFGFGELSHGNLALWDPHIYGGAPYFGGTQAAMLYPTNVLLLFMPLPLAINWSIAINVWLLGAFMYLWTAYRGLRPMACFVSGVMLMFCGPHFLHVYGGHPVHMAVMTWAPLVFLAIDGVFCAASRKQIYSWCLLGMFAVAMQILGGHPQYLFFTGIAAGVYGLFGGFQRFGKLPRTGLSAPQGGKRFFEAYGVPMVSIAAIFGGGSALAAIQLFTAVQANGETIRSVKVPFEFASMFGFPPENLLTLLNPYFFGDMEGQAYWGRCYLWEMSLFVGVTGLVLAIYGAFYGRPEPATKTKGAAQGKKNKKEASVAVADPVSVAAGAKLPSTGIMTALVVVTFILALGVHTPLFEFLYNFCPGFSKFRGISKFTFQTSLFLGMLAAIGFDRILIKPKLERRFVMGLAIAGGFVLLMAGYLFVMSPNDFQGWLKAIQATRESYMPAGLFSDLNFAGQSKLFASKALLIPGLLLLATAGLFNFAPRWRHAFTLFTALLVAESFFFALHTRDTLDTKTIIPAGVKEALAKNPGDYRILDLMNPNSALSIGAQDLWGMDPGVVSRYSAFIAGIQGISPERATQYDGPKSIDPLYTMFRFRFAFVPKEDGSLGVIESPVPPMQRLELIPECKVIRKRDEIFATMRSQDFNPRKEVILEEAPSPFPAAGSSENVGKAKVVASSTDWLEVEADVTAPSILLNTDIYTPAWRAIALPGSAQNSYKLQPANYALRGIALGAGHHHLRIEYAPSAFFIGKWVTLISGLLFVAVAGWLGFLKVRPANESGELGA
jgi:hypothetical protein